MIYLRSLVKKKPLPAEEYPGSLPLVRALERLDFTSPVTLLTGENGSGKSTVVRLLAEVTGAFRVGNVRGDRASARAAEHFGAVFSARPAHRFFFGAEDFAGYIADLERAKAEARSALREADELNCSDYARGLYKMPHARTLAEIEGMYAHNLSERSHGEGYLDFFLSRLRPNGFYLLDEPEGALSHVSQLALVAAIKRAEKEGCQFVVCTHSPVVAACPGADIREIEEGEIRKADYEELSSVCFLREFFRARERVMRELTED